jgi:hypothetical protein
VSHLNSAYNRARVGQGEFKVEVLANLEGSFDLELKSFLGHIIDFAQYRLSTVPELTCSINRDSEKFSLLAHRSASCSSGGEAAAVSRPETFDRHSSTFASIAVEWLPDDSHPPLSRISPLEAKTVTFRLFVCPAGVCVEAIFTGRERPREMAEEALRHWRFDHIM